MDKLKQYKWYAIGLIGLLLISAGYYLWPKNVNLGATVLNTYQGGTGLSTYSVGDLIVGTSSNGLYKLPIGASGKVLKVNSGVPYWGTDNTGGGGADGNWVYNTDGFLYEMTSTLPVVVGADATSTNDNLQVVGSAHVSATTTLNGKVLIGSTASVADFPQTQLIVSNGDTGHTYSSKIGGLGEAVAAIGQPSVGWGGIAQTNGIFPGYGVAGRALVLASSDSGAAVGVEGLSEATHSGGSNIGIYSTASGGLLNYSFYGNAGNIYNNGNLTIVGSSTLATTTMTNATSTSFFSTLLNSITGFITNLTATNSTTTNATTTNLSVSTSFNFLGTVITNVSTWFNGLANTWLSGKSTTNLAEGTNLYYTDNRVRDYVVASTTLQTVFSNANTAYGWGNHAIAGYLTSLLGGLNGIFGNTTTTNATTTNISVSGAYKDWLGSAGTQGYLLQSIGTSTKWVESNLGGFSVYASSSMMSQMGNGTTTFSKGISENGETVQYIRCKTTSATVGIQYGSQYILASTTANRIPVNITIAAGGERLWNIKPLDANVTSTWCQAEGYR